MRNLVTIILCLAASLSAAATKTEKFTVSVPPPAPAGERVLAPQELVILVSAAGDVTDLHFRTSPPDPIRVLVDRAVRSWKFAPHQVDGRPVAWATGMTVGLNAVPLNDQGQFGLKVTRAHVQDGFVPSLTPPRYPPERQMHHKGALVCVDVRLAADGRLEVVDIPLVNGAPPRKGDPFVAAVREAAATWTATPVEFDGKRYASVLVSRIPVTFQPDVQREEVPTSCPPLATPDAETLKLLSNPVGAFL